MEKYNQYTFNKDVLQTLANIVLFKSLSNLGAYQCLFWRYIAKQFHRIALSYNISFQLARSFLSSFVGRQNAGDFEHQRESLIVSSWPKFFQVKAN